MLGRCCEGKKRSSPCRHLLKKKNMKKLIQIKLCVIN